MTATRTLLPTSSCNGSELVTSGHDMASQSLNEEKRSQPLGNGRTSRLIPRRVKGLEKGNRDLNKLPSRGPGHGISTMGPPANRCRPSHPKGWQARKLTVSSVVLASNGPAGFCNTGSPLVSFCGCLRILVASLVRAMEPLLGDDCRASKLTVC